MPASSPGEIDVAAQGLVDLGAVRHPEPGAGHGLDDHACVPAIGPVVAVQARKAVLPARHRAGDAAIGTDCAEIDGVGQCAVGILRLEAGAGAQPGNRPPGHCRVDVDRLQLGADAMVAADPVAGIVRLQSER